MLVSTAMRPVTAHAADKASAAHDDAAERLEDTATATGLARALRDQNARAVLLVQLLQPCREIHRVAQQGVAQPLAGADRAADHGTGTDADPGVERHAL